MSRHISASHAGGLLALTDQLPERFAAEMLDAQALDFSGDPADGFADMEPLAAEKPAHSRVISVIMAAAGAAACVAVLLGAMLALHRRGTERLNSGPASSEWTAKTTISTVSTVTTASTASTATETVSATVSTALTDSPVSTESTLQTSSTVSTTQTDPTLSTQPAVTDTPVSAAQTSDMIETGETAITTTEQITQPSGADPEAVIAELKAGRPSVFNWDGAGGKCCVESWQTYGVAFLCENEAALTGASIGGHPVFLSEGAWSQYGGTPYYHDAAWDTRIDSPSAIGANDCMVQRLADFEREYGKVLLADGGIVHYRSTVSEAEARRLRLEYEAAGQTVYMAAIAGDGLKFTQESGGTAYDYSEIIRAIAADDSMTLIGLIWCREDTYGTLNTDEMRIIVDFAPGYVPDAADYAEYGVLQKFVGHWEILTALEPDKVWDKPDTETWRALREMCTALEARPEVVSAVPELDYPL